MVKFQLHNSTHLTSHMFPLQINLRAANIKIISEMLPAKTYQKNNPKGCANPT
jgi:hypothetical protein